MMQFGCHFMFIYAGFQKQIIRDQNFFNDWINMQVLTKQVYQEIE